MCLLTQLLALPDVQVDGLTIDDDRILITLTPQTTAAPCPTCGVISTRVHSAYARVLTDLPWGRRQVHLTLSLRRFRCRASACSRQTFVERHPAIAPAYARTTLRLRQQHQLLALAAGGELGARLIQRLGMASSPDTLIRLIRAMPLPSIPPPIRIGIDDWAQRKGQTYGTLIIDLDRRQPIDVLSERTAEVVDTWLQQHPSVQLVTRDRADAYIDGITRGAPQAMQVADRWHLTKNLGDALQRMLERYGPQLRAAAKGPPQNTAQRPLVPEPDAVSPPVVLPQPGASSRRQAQFAEVKRLRSCGWSISRIARDLGLNRRTVYSYDRRDQVPVRMLPQNRSLALPFLPQIQALLREGTPTCQQILTVLQAQGFQGSYTSLHRLLKRMGWSRAVRTGHVVDHAVRRAARGYSARQVMWMLLGPEQARLPDEQHYLESLIAHCPNVGTGAVLAQRFLTMIRQRDAAALNAWLVDAEASGIKELRQFAKGLRRDDGAVRSALREPYSNGPVEAQVQQLKRIKRNMNGRANFDLLRKRVLLRI